MGSHDAGAQESPATSDDFYAKPVTISELEHRFGITAGAESVDSLVGGGGAVGGAVCGGAALGIANLRRAIEECSSLLPPRVKEEAEGVAFLAELSATASLAWPACAAGRRVGELIIRQGAPVIPLEGHQVNLNATAILSSPRTAKKEVSDPMLALVRVGNKGAHTETCCQDVDARFACDAVAATLRGLYRC